MIFVLKEKSWFYLKSLIFPVLLVEFEKKTFSQEWGHSQMIMILVQNDLIYRMSTHSTMILNMEWEWQSLWKWDHFEQESLSFENDLILKEKGFFDSYQKYCKIWLFREKQIIFSPKLKSIWYFDGNLIWQLINKRAQKSN